MPIVFKKDLHFGDSDNDQDNALTSFLDDVDDDSFTMKPPPSKKRKLENTPTKSALQSSNIKQKAKVQLKKLRIKRRKERSKLKRNPSNGSKMSSNVSVVSIESMKPKESAIKFQKIFCQTLEISSKNLGILFNESHFLSVSRDLDPINNNIDFGSLDVLRLFLDSNYQNIPKKEGEDEKPMMKDAEKTSKKNQWKAYTKSMQVVIICPSVRKSVDTIKALQSIRVNHSFIHKKQTLKMTEEQWAKHKEAMEELCVIPLRVCELFGKHRKIEYQQKELKNKSWHVGVGGVNRISKLMQSKHLNLKQCELIMIDLQRNAKDMSILDMPQMRKEFCEWFKLYAFERIQAGEMKIALF